MPGVEKMWLIGGYSGGYKNDVWYSVDGVVWTQATANAAFSVRQNHSCVVYNGKIYLTGGDVGGGGMKDVWSSEDGVNWTQLTNNAQFGYAYRHNMVVFNDGTGEKIWLFREMNDVSSRSVWVTSDGINWQKQADSTNLGYRRIYGINKYGNRMWIAGGYEPVQGYYKNDIWYYPDNQFVQNTPTETPQFTSTPTPIMVNCGGNVYIAQETGYYWAADKAYTAGSWGYTAGNVRSVTDPIYNTTDDPLYQNDRNGVFSYKFDVQNGLYEVTLYFAELYWHNYTGRLFDVNLEGMTVLDNYSIAQSAQGWDKAIQQVFQVNVSDGQLNIDFADGTADHPSVAGIIIRQLGPVQTATITPTCTDTGTFTVTETATETVTETATETETETVTGTTTETATETATETITETITFTVTETVTESVTESITATVTETSSRTATKTITETVTETVTVSITQTQTATVTKSITDTVTATVTDTATKTSTQTATEAETNTSTLTATQTITETATQTQTSTSTATKTNTQTITITDTPAATITVTASKTNTQTITSTGTPSITLTATNTTVANSTATPCYVATYTYSFNNPTGVAIDGSGNIYVLDANNSRVVKLNSSGQYQTSWNGLTYPYGITVDDSGYVYVADCGTNMVRKYNSSGTYITGWSSQYPRCIKYYNNSIYVSDIGAVDSVKKYSTGGTLQATIATQGSADGQVNGPLGMDFDSSGNLYIVDGENKRIQKFNSSLQFVSKWGTYGSGDGQFNSPTDIVVGTDGYIYVSDSANHRIQKFTTSGTFLTKFGPSQGSATNQFSWPAGMDGASGGYLYIADQFNHRIKKYDLNCTPPTPTVTLTVTPTNTPEYFQSSIDKALILKTPEVEEISAGNTFSYPNPCSDAAIIRFSLKEILPVTISIYDINNRLVWKRIIAENELKAGINTVKWDLKNGRMESVANGVYLYSVSTNSTCIIKKIAVIK